MFPGNLDDPTHGTRVQPSYLQSILKVEAGDSLGHLYSKHSDCCWRGRPGKALAKLTTKQLVKRTGKTASGRRERKVNLQSFTLAAAHTLSPKLTVHIVSGKVDCQAHALWNQRVLVDPRIIRWVG